MFESALSAAQGDAEGALRSAGSLTRELRKAKAAAATGQVREYRRALDAVAGLLFGRLACLQTDCAITQHGASAGAGRGQLGVKARGVARRGATWRILERAAAPPGAGQARDAAPIWPRQARRASGLTGGR